MLFSHVEVLGSEVLSKGQKCFNVETRKTQVNFSARSTGWDLFYFCITKYELILYVYSSAVAKYE